jgi:hypothetical protein
VVACAAVLQISLRRKCSAACKSERNKAPLLQRGIDQSQIRRRIKPLLRLYRIDGHGYFQRWRHIRIENVPGTRCSVRTPHHHVGMDDGLSLIKRYVAAHPNHFVLVVDWNLLVHLALGIEPSQCCPLQRSDSSEVRTRNVIRFRKLQQSGERLVALVEDDRIMLRRF